MKKIIFWAIALVTLTAVFSSCEKTEQYCFNPQNKCFTFEHDSAVIDIYFGEEHTVVSTAPYLGYDFIDLYQPHVTEHDKVYIPGSEWVFTLTVGGITYKGSALEPLMDSERRNALLGW